jgi:hypothetical protein
MHIEALWKIAKILKLLRICAGANEGLFLFYPLPEIIIYMGNSCLPVLTWGFFSSFHSLPARLKRS